MSLARKKPSSGFEEMLTPTMYLLPDHPEVRQVRFASLFENPKFIGSRG